MYLAQTLKQILVLPTSFFGHSHLSQFLFTSFVLSSPLSHPYSSSFPPSFSLLTSFSHVLIFPSVPSHRPLSLSLWLSIFHPPHFVQRFADSAGASLRCPEKEETQTHTHTHALHFWLWHTHTAEREIKIHKIFMCVLILIKCPPLLLSIKSQLWV